MKISTAYFFDRATTQVVDAQSRLSTTTAQLALSKQLLAPSDAPDQALAIDRLRNAVTRQEGLSTHLRTVQSRLNAEETALSSINSMLTRIKELAIRGVDDHLNASDRSAVAQEMKVLREQLVTIANSRDDQGQYLFGGASVDDPPYVQGSDGRVSYQGDQTAAWVRSGDQDMVEFNRAGSAALPRLVRTTDGVDEGIGLFDVVDDLTTAVTSNDSDGMQRGIGEMDSMLTSVGLSMVRTGADQKAIDDRVAIVDETVLRLKSTQSGLEDLDYAEAVSRMAKQKMALEAAMSSFAKVSQMNLFAYINP